MHFSQSARSTAARHTQLQIIVSLSIDYYRTICNLGHGDAIE